MATKDQIRQTCPVCGETMRTVLCPDDIIRMGCPKCHKTYTPIGYSDDPDYGKKWSVIDWNNNEKHAIVEVD